MPSIDRPLSGDVLVFDLAEERGRTADPALIERGGRNARTLIKDGPLRVTLIVVAPGGVIPEHQADGPIIVQPIRGRLRFTAAGREHELGPGDLLTAGPGVRHAVSSDGGCTFLLTMAHSAERRAAAKS